MKFSRPDMHDVFNLALAGFILAGTIVAVRQGNAQAREKQIALAAQRRVLPPVVTSACPDPVLTLLEIAAQQAEAAGMHYEHAHADHFMASRYRRVAQETRAVQRECRGQGVVQGGGSVLIGPEARGESPAKGRTYMWHGGATVIYPSPGESPAEPTDRSR